MEIYDESIVSSSEPVENEELVVPNGNEVIMSFQDKVNLVNQGIENSGKLMQSVENIYSMHQRTKQLEMMTQMQLANTVAKYQLCHEFLDNTFKERHGALQKHYDLLDRAVESNDREMILASLHGISSIVTTSPLSELQRLASVFDNTDVPLLDF